MQIPVSGEMVADCVAAAITRNRLSTATRAELENRLPTATFRRHVTTSRCRGSRSCNQNASGAKRRRPRSEEDDGDCNLQRLRTENTDLRRHPDIYEGHMRMLTIANQQLRQQLEHASGLTDINERRTR